MGNTPSPGSNVFYAAYGQMTDKLRPWTIDFHVAQNDGDGGDGIIETLEATGAQNVSVSGTAQGGFGVHEDVGAEGGVELVDVRTGRPAVDQTGEQGLAHDAGNDRSREALLARFLVVREAAREHAGGAREAGHVLDARVGHELGEVLAEFDVLVALHEPGLSRMTSRESTSETSSSPS